MQFQAKIFDPAHAQTRTQSVDALDAAAGRSLLEAQGLVVLKLQNQARARDWRSLVRRSGPGRFDVRLVCIELSALLRAGLSLSEGLESLASRSEDRSAEVYRDLVEQMLQGRSLSDAMQSSPFVFPQILIAAVRANERTGRIADALDEFARFESALRDLRRKAVSAAVYPLLVVVFGSLVALFLLGYVVPRFSAIYDDTTVTISLATRVILFIGRSIAAYGIFIGAGAAIIVAVALRWLADPAGRRRLLGSILSRWPIAAYARTFQLQRICQSLAMLLKGGYALPQALQLAGALAVQPALQQSLVFATRAVEEGRSASAAWLESGLADPFARRILQAGERTGALAIGFETLAATYARDVETAMERSARLIEPALLMIVASVIGAIVVLMYMPIFDLAGTVQ